ncbi:MAG TPA: nucleotidyl transferase AbiEii/AbiGii toxin family protein [Planctomycetota bacterium]|nr:nucleotidyl transferase AbiEii/AbiGii toxin family protein [Planctomycetota bacterium]
MASSPVGLSPLQQDLLREFFARERRFVLTGGGALVGFHLRHRTSQDLDLFTKPPVDLAEGRQALTAAVTALGGSMEAVKTFPEFQRLLVRRGGETVLVDLVVDRAPDVDVVEDRQGIRLHSLREIAANKICALLGRGEIRDLVDLREILERGLDLASVVSDAERKDGGVSAATLAWLLDSIRIAGNATLPGGIAPATLESFRVDLVRRLRALGKPGP